MASGDEGAKHPYVTPQNSRVHLTFSIILTILSLIQIILGLVFSELIVKEVEYHMSHSKYGLHYYTNYFYGDHTWIGFVGLILASIGYSTWLTRSRSNGFVLTTMLFISAIIIYPIAIGLGVMGGNVMNQDFSGYNGIRSLRIGSSVYLALQAFFIGGWAVYTARHICCNPNVRRTQQLTISGTNQNVVYITPPQNEAGNHPPSYSQSTPDSKPPAYTE